MKYPGIDDRELTFVVQGPIIGRQTSGGTARVIESIRNYYPGSALIVSTWKGSFLDGISADKIILSEDPGSYYRDPTNKIYHNANRQIVSTVNGLRQVETSHAIKLRSDLLVTDRGLAYWLGSKAREMPRDATKAILQQRVLITNVTTVNPRKVEPLPFHPCDWIYAGLREDLLNIWDVPHFPEPSFTHWFENRPKPHNFPFPTSLARFHPENYIWSEFLRKHVDLQFAHSSDVTAGNIELSEAIFANNVVILSNLQLGIQSLKHTIDRASYYRMYTHEEWLRLVSKYVGLARFPRPDSEGVKNWTAYKLKVLRSAFSKSLLRKCISKLARTIKLRN